MSMQHWPSKLRLRIKPRSLAVTSIGLAIVLLAASGWTGRAWSQTAAASEEEPKLHVRPESSLQIGVGDMLHVDVFDTPELSAKLRVNADGAVDLPVAGNTVVIGMTTQQAAEVVAKHYKEARIMTNPQVTVTIAEYATQQISVLGEVKNPGNYLLLGPHSLLNALSAAGGTTEKAGGDIVITHVADPQNPETVPASSPEFAKLQRMTAVKAGDVILVTRAGSVYVLGDVAKPGEFSMAGGKGITVLQAIALAQGTNSDAALKHAAIIRKTGDGSRIIPIDLKRMTDQADSDKVLYAEDIIVVPRSRGRAFMDATLPGLTGSLAGSAVAALILMGR